MPDLRDWNCQEPRAWLWTKKCNQRGVGLLECSADLIGVNDISINFYGISMTFIGNHLTLGVCSGMCITFYPCDAMRRTDLCDSDVSGCLSVTAGIVSKRRELASWFLHPLIASWFNSLVRYDSSKNSQGITPSEGDLWEWHGFERAFFCDFSTYKPPYLRNGQYTNKVTIEH